MGSVMGMRARAGHSGEDEDKEGDDEDQYD